MAQSETPIVNSILLALQSLDGVKVWRQNTGGLYTRSGRLIKFGVLGCADVSGIASPEGWRIEIEVKRPGGRGQSAQQKRFQAMIESLGGMYFVARGPQEACQLLHSELCKRRSGIAAPVCANARCRQLIESEPVTSKAGAFCSEKCRKSAWNRKGYAKKAGKKK